KVVVLSCVIAWVIRVWYQQDVGVVVPLFQHVRAVAYWVFAEGIHVIECRFRKWCESRVAEALWEVRGWGIHGDLEGLVINDFEAFELIDAFFCIRSEERRVGKE